MSDDAREEPGFDDRLTLALEILVMRDTVQDGNKRVAPAVDRWISKPIVP